MTTQQEISAVEVSAEDEQTPAQTVTGAHLMTRALRELGVEIVAGIPGHTIFSFANAVREEDGLRPLLVRNEAVAAFAADVYYRISGRLMAVFTHSFPGTGNTIAAVANAYADSSALLLLTGETAGPVVGRGAYQELSRQFDGDVGQLVRHVVKRVWQPRTAHEIPEQLFRAVRTATALRPGPVAIDVFQEIWDETVEIADLPRAADYVFGNPSRPAAGHLARAASLLSNAERPLIVAGNGVNLARARGQLRQLAEELQCPVATTVTGKGAFPEGHPLSVGIIGWVGTSTANHAGRRADVVLSIGCRMSETTSSSWTPGVTFDLAGTTLIQVDVDPLEIGNAYPVDVPLIGDAGETMTDLTAAVATARPAGGWSRKTWLDDVATERARWQDVVATSQQARPGGLPSVGEVVAGLRRQFADEPVNVICDVGKNHKWLVQQFEAGDDDYIVSSMGGGTMGIGPCGAVGAALARPSARTIAWVGDGSMSMNSFVWPTVAEYRIPVAYVVIDDRAYGAVANIQEDRFGEYVYSLFDGSGTNPDYTLDLAALAEASGLPARTVVGVDDLADGLRWVHEQDGPAVLVVRVDRHSEAPNGGGSKARRPWVDRVYPWRR